MTARWRLLALDLDGTIVSQDLSVDDRDVAALARAMAAGVTVIACTGRPFLGALPWVRRLGLPGPLICYQGAQVRDLDGGTVLDHGVCHEPAMEVVHWCRERDLHVHAYKDDRLILERDRPEAHTYSRHAGMEIHVVGDLDAAMGPTTPKVVVVAEPERVDRLLPEMRERWAGRLYVATSLPYLVEVTAPDATKRRALEFLSRRLGIPREAAAAAGDGRNDQPMLEWAGLGFAVEGAPHEVLAAAGGRTIGSPGTGGIVSLVSCLLDDAARA